MGEPLFPNHGGYRGLKSFQLARLTYDLTVHFADTFIAKNSRTHDQMVQAARSGVQNIAEGSQVSGTSKKMEMKLTNVARASLEELRLDYEDFLRQRTLPLWSATHPALKRFKALRCNDLGGVLAWAEDEERRAKERTEHGRAPTWAREFGRDSPCRSVLLANAALSLLNLVCHFLDRQLESQARAFEREGGFTERLYRHRKDNRND